MGAILMTKQVSFENFLHYPNISINERTVTFISGPSGCGKSTLLKLFNGTLSPSTGSVFYYGDDIATRNMVTLRREVLLVKQVPYLFQGSILHNFTMYHEMQESVCPSEEVITTYLQCCCIPVSLDTQCATMSGGERQRVFLSIALSLLPKVLLLDEPTSALHKELSITVLKNIIEYAKQQNITFVIISHDMELQSTFAEHVITLRRES